jgi:hypothetical protein
LHLFGPPSCRSGFAARRQNPMHQFGRPFRRRWFAARRPPAEAAPTERPEAGIIDVLPKPHAPIRPPAAAVPTERAGGPASSRRAAKTPCTNSPSQPPPRSGDRQQPWRRRDRGSCTVRTGPLANQVTHSRVRTPCTCSLTARRDRAATPNVQRWHPDFQRRPLAAAAAAGQRRVGNQQQRPLAPIQAAVSATQGGRGRQDPMHLKRSPNRRCPPSHPACNETMARLAQQRAAR